MVDVIASDVPDLLRQINGRTVTIGQRDPSGRSAVRRDPCHLMENASRAFLDAVRKSMHQVRHIVGATRIDSGLLTAAERKTQEGL